MARKYKCPFCSKSFVRDKLSAHISKTHSDMIDEDHEYTADRIVFDICNHKEPIGGGHSNCRICKKPTKWNQDLVRYDAYCSKECKNKARELYKENMLRVRGTYNLLEDPEWQETKMLANRKITDKYRWSDGTYKTYVGSYEKKFLEFCDNVLKIDSSDLVTPGPKIEYEFHGEKHTWITDAIYLPYKLVFDIKDGGDNKNNRSMPEYREKQIQKEKFITDQGQYNYIRLTNNEFVQLLQIFAELKMMYMEMDGDSMGKTISRIHESCTMEDNSMIFGALPPNWSSDVQIPGNCSSDLFVTSYKTKKNKDKSKYKKKKGIVVTNDIVSDKVLTVEDGHIVQYDSDELLEDCDIVVYKYTGPDKKDKLIQIYKDFKEGMRVPDNYFVTMLTGFDELLVQEQLDFSDTLSPVNLNIVSEMYETTISSLKMLKEHTPMLPLISFEDQEMAKTYLRGISEDVSIQQTPKGYIVYNKVKHKYSRPVGSIYDITPAMIDSTL